MAWVGDLDFLRPRKITVSTRGISVGGRLMALTGAIRFEPGGQKQRDKTATY